MVSILFFVLSTCCCWGVPQIGSVNFSSSTNKDLHVQQELSDKSGRGSVAGDRNDREVAAESSQEKDDFKVWESKFVQTVAKAKKATVAIVLGFTGGVASGVLVSDDGIILTAGHCIDKAGQKFKIVLSDGREYQATSFGYERSYDCGLIRIDPDQLKGDKLPYAPMGYAYRLKPNQPCISLGHGGVYNAQRGAYVRYGHVASLVTATYGMIRSTCLMEPGDSGGPLFDLDGRVIGIHSQISSSLDSNYEVSIDIFRRYWKQLNTPKRFFGHRVNDFPNFGLYGRRTGSWKSKRAFKLIRVTKSSWAESNGLKKDDVILKMDGSRISGRVQLDCLLYLRYLQKKEHVVFEISRDGKKKTLKLELPSIADDPNPMLKDGKSIAGEGGKWTLARLGKMFGDLEEKLDDYCVMISSKKNGRGAARKSMGTVLEIGKAQVIVGKSSEVLDGPKIILDGDKEIEGKVLFRNANYDLVFIRIPKKIRSISVGQVPKGSSVIGRILISPSPKDSGELSVRGSGEFENRGSGYLGLTFSNQPDEDSGEEGVVVRTVQRKQAASKAGVQSGDIIRKIDGRAVSQSSELVGVLKKKKPGQVVQLELDRDGKSIELLVTLGSRPTKMLKRMESMHVAGQFKGGMSQIFTGFPKVFVHDGRVHPNACGGPVFSTDGIFEGINIARRSRTQCYAVGRETILQVFQKAIRSKNKNSTQKQ